MSGKQEVAYTIRARDGYSGVNRLAQQSVTKTAKVVGVASVAMVGSAGLVTASLFAMTKATASSGDEFQKMSARLGISSQSLSEMKHAVELSGAELSTYEMGLRKLSKGALDADRGLATYKRSFDELGVSVRDANGKMKDSDALFMDVVAGLNNIESSTKKTALAQELLGRSGTMLLPLINSGAAGIKEMRQEAQDLGITFSDIEANESAAFVDAMLRVKGTVVGTKNSFTKELMPAITVTMDTLAASFIDFKKTGELDKWAADTAEGVITAFAEMAKFGTQIPIAWQSIIIASKEVGAEIISVFSTALVPLEKLYDVLEELPGTIGQPYREAKADIVAFREDLDAIGTGMALSTDENKRAADEWAVWSGKAISAIDAVRNRASDGGIVAGPSPGGVGENGETSVLSPEETPEALAIKTRMQFRDEEILQLQTFDEVKAFYAERNMVMLENEEAAVVAANFRMAQSAAARQRITSAANQAMSDQMLHMIELHKFSVSAIGQAIAQQVKIEMVGIAAKAAVKALYFTGMGLVSMTPWGAAEFGPPGPWFAGAGKMAAVSAASLAGAAGVHAIAGGGAQQGAPGSPTGEPIMTQPGPSLLASDSQQNERTTQNVTLNIHALDPSSINWDKYSEDIVDTINKAGKERDVKITMEAVRV